MKVPILQVKHDDDDIEIWGIVADKCTIIVS